MCFFMHAPVFAQQAVQYGGPIPQDLQDAANNKTSSPSGVAVSRPVSSVFLRGGAPINLRPGAYVDLDVQAVSQTAEAQPQQGAPLKPTAVAVHNQNILKTQARNAAAANKKTVFPPGW